MHNRKHRVKVHGCYSQWGRVTSGIPQGSVLGPLLFLIYINDLPEFCEMESGIYLFADDAKLFKYIKGDLDRQRLQDGLDRLQEWTDKWLLKLNCKKCKVISFGRNPEVDHEYILSDGSKLGREEQITDLGVIMDSQLRFSEHIQAKINKAYGMIGVINRNFNCMSVESFVTLYKCMVRSQLDYCNSVWAPYRKSDIEDLEKVQKRATKILPYLSKLSYEDRLRKCNLPTLKFRSIRGDLIEAYKIITGKYDLTVSPKLKFSKIKFTRGNDYKLDTVCTSYELRKHFFTNRIINIWNSLPNDVVKADTTNQFKNRLDWFWRNQELIYNYKAELTGIGSRSEFVK